MHICLVAANDARDDPRARVTRTLLERAGHRVTTVAVGTGSDRPETIYVDTRPRGLIEKGINRLAPGSRKRRVTTALTRTAITTKADAYLPTGLRSLEAAVTSAKATGGVVLRTPKMPDVGDVDLINVAPSRPEAALPAAGIGTFHVPSDQRAPYTPTPDRHRDRRVVLCYRRSEINPGRYLEAALRRSGADLRVEVNGIDLDTVDPSTDFVLFVEGPYPALAVTGSTRVPTLFWAHHGEHHLHANVRLADRYQADAVLLAHSWHLALWFPAPVHRFPFGVSTELLDPSKRLSERRYDVAMVGAGLRTGGQYGRRQQLVAALESAFPADRLGFAENVSAPEMAALYADSRVVINEGGTRHYPITMRVMETVGSGAVLLSDPLPGMEMLLDRDTDFETLSDDVAADVTRIVDDLLTSQQKADSALEKALARHTYDHRVDELFAIAESTVKRPIPDRPQLSPLAAVVDDDVQVQRVAHWNAPELVDELVTREVWDARQLDPARLAPGKMESVAIRSDEVEGLRDLLRSARRFIYVDGEASDLAAYLEEERPESVLTEPSGIKRVDTMAPSYRIMDFESTSP